MKTRNTPGNKEGSYYLVHVPDPFRPLQGQIGTTIPLADLLTDATIAKVRETAHWVQSNWYHHRGRDYSQWNSFSLGKMVAGAILRNELHAALGNYAAFRELLRRHPDTTSIEIRHDPGINSGIWQAECDRQCIGFRPLTDEAIQPNERPGRRLFLQRKRRVLTRSLAVLKRWKRHRPNSRPLAMLCDSGSLTLRHTDFCRSLENSPFVDIVRSRDVLSTSRRRGITKRTIKETSGYFAGVWNSLQLELQQCDLLEEVTGGGRSHVISILRDTYLQRLPHVAGTVAIAEATLKTMRPTVLIAEAQPGNEDYAWSSVAQSLGIPVVSITNELWTHPRDDHNFAPVSDFILLGSPLSRPWWRAKGFGKDAILPSRCRFLDTPNRSRGAQSKFVTLCAVTRFCPDLMDISATHWRQFVRKILSVAQSRPEIQFIIKFHPGTPRLEGYSSFARQLEFVKHHSPPNVEVAPLDSSLPSYLRRADCFVCSSSSFTIFEALAQGVTCVLAPPKSAILDQCPIFRAMKKYSRVTDLENMGAEIDAVKSDANDVPSDWFDGVLYSEPRPIEVVEQLAMSLHRQSAGGAAA